MTFVISSLLITNAILIIFFSFIAKYLNLIDKPNERKSHIGNIPLIGGISIYFSFIIHLYFIDLPFFINVIFLSGLVLIIIGIFDDSFQLSVTIRLLFQLIASLIVVGSGLNIIDIGNYEIYGNIELGIFGVLFSIFAVTATINAYNFMDGIDGLAAGLILVALFSILFFSYLNQSTQNIEIIIYAIVLVSLFLIINLKLTPFNKIFLGDAGSMFLGFLIAWLLIFYTHPDFRNFHPVLTLWCVSIPAYDSFAVFINRLKRNQNPFMPNKDHIHHLLIQSGYNQRLALLIILLFSIFLSIAGGLIFYFLGALVCFLSYFLFFFLYILLITSKFHSS